MQVQDLPSPCAHPWPRELGTDDFDKARRLIQGRAGIVLADHKRQMVYNRLVRRVRALNQPGFADYLALLDDPAHPEWDGFISAMTTNVTSFFRERHHLDRLRLHFPADAPPPALIWSAGCSTGEETYSIAMALEETFGLDRLVRHGTRILGTDIDLAALQRAAAGIFSAGTLAPVPAAQLARCFVPVDTPPPATGPRQYRVHPLMAALVHFQPLNLMAPCWGAPFDSGGFDAIFCRNVMIYFDGGTQRRLVRRFARSLDAASPAGLFFAGHSEMLLQAGDVLESLGQTTYRLRRPAQVPLR